MKVDKKTDVVLLMLEAVDEIETVIKFQKILFLMHKDTTLFETRELCDLKFEFNTMKTGPVSMDLYDELMMLENIGLIELREIQHDATDEYERVRTVKGDDPGHLVSKSFSLTDNGKKKTEELEVSSNVKNELQEFVQDKNRLSVRMILEDVYERFPAYAKEWYKPLNI